MKFLVLILSIFFVIQESVCQEKLNSLELSGKVILIDKITNTGDTIFSNQNKISVNILLYNKDSLVESFSINQNDSVNHYLPYDSFHLLFFECKGYYIKGLEIDTYNISENSKGINYGFIFPYDMKLVKKPFFKRNIKDIVAKIFYNKEKDYFDFKKL